MSKSYCNRSYSMVVKKGVDALMVDKSSGSDWSRVSTVIHGTIETVIVIRSKEMAEALQFMLGQMLRVDE